MKKDKLVCIGGDWDESLPHPVKGEIYTYLSNAEREGFICLVEFGTDYGFSERCFRPVDETFGPAVCETIEQQIEYEKALEPVYQ